MNKRHEVTEEDYTKLLELFGRLSARKAWSQVTREDFTVRRFDSGFINEIACCELTPEAAKRLIKDDREPTGIVVKFYPENFFFQTPIWEMTVVHLTLSDAGLSPKLYYIDDKCMIHHYVPSRNYSRDDDLDPEMVLELARVLARFHSLNPPISDESHKKWSQMMETFNDKSAESQKLFDGGFLEQIKQDPDGSIAEKYYATLSTIDLNKIDEFIRRVRRHCESPLVFSHSDFNRGNRLVSTERDANGNVSKRVRLVDFDYSTTGDRGLDLGRFFSSYRHVDDNFGYEPFPTDEQMRLFLDEYRAECGRLLGKSYLDDPTNSIEHLIEEAKLQALIAIFIDFWFCLMMYHRDPTSPRKTYFLDGAKNRYLLFCDLRTQCHKDGVLPPEIDF